MAVESTTGVNLSDAMILADVPLGDWLVIAPVALPILAGAVLLMFRHYTRTQGMIAIAALALLLAADIAVRLMTTGRELNVGVLTALIGAPFFLWLVMSNRRVMT